MGGCSLTIRRTEISPWVWPTSNLNAVPRQAQVGAIHRIARPRVRLLARARAWVKKSILRNQYSLLAKRLRSKLVVFARVAAPARKCAWNDLRTATKEAFLFH